MKYSHSFYLFFITIGMISILGCAKDDDEPINCTLQVAPVIINFNFIDKTTSEDLYFSTNPRFQIRDLYFFRKKDVAMKDTIRPSVIGSGTGRSFQYNADYSKLNDTLILKTGNLSEDTITYIIEKTNTPCLNYKLGSVTFNGAIVSLSSEKFKFLK
ncbi:hypothetical protein [Pedobacter sp.]|uniref:hypothetical protein n=1 Tax=Pedobacter sp. TaxID=1411316 RepID=UPI003D7FF758